MPSWEGKKYKLEKSENFDEYMKTLGVGLVLRKMGNTVTPTVDLSQNGDEYTLTTASTFKTTSVTFTPNVEFDEETADGRKVKSVMRFETPDKLIHEQKGEKPTTIIREFTETSLTATMTIEDVKCIREYKAT